MRVSVVDARGEELAAGGIDGTMWKNNYFFEDRKITFTPKIAKALLKNKKAKVKDICSHKTGKTYDGNVVLCDTKDKYVNYRIEIERKKKEE